MDLKGSKTEANLWAALNGECLATNKYLYFAKQARKDGYEQMADIFEETSHNEKAHAKIWFKKLGELGDTKANLASCIAGEHYEHSEMYPGFAKVAFEEGFAELAGLFNMVGVIEYDHETRYKNLLDNIEKGTVFKKDTPQEWICLECGNIHVGPEAPPENCPVCDHPQSHRAIYKKTY